MIDPVIEPTWIDYVIVAMLVVIMPAFSALVTIPRVKRLSAKQLNRIRLRIYVQIIVAQWLFVAAALYPVVLRGVPLPTVGVSFYPENLFRFGIGAIVLLGIVLGLAWQRGKLSELEEGRRLIRKSMKDILWVVPHSMSERRLWTVVSLHAGIGEELFFRGYLLALLNANLPLWAACVIMVVMFGLGHSYQGIGGVLKTMGAGALFLGFYLWSGSLWLAILLHVFVDINSGAIGYWAVQSKHESPADA